jgi:hypothetical protein
MTESSTTVTNRALHILGQQRITALLETNKRAVAMNDVYTQIRREILKQFPWPFAIKRVLLSQLVTTPAFGYTYEYQLPSDFLKMLHPLDENYAFEYQLEGTKLLTDEGSADAFVRYVYDCTNESLFDPLFVKLFAYALARETSYELTQDKVKTKEVSDGYDEVLRETRSLLSQESPIPQSTWQGANSWMTARNG